MAAMARSWLTIVIFSGATTPISAGDSLSATSNPISAAMATGARLVGV